MLWQIHAGLVLKKQECKRRDTRKTACFLSSSAFTQRAYIYTFLLPLRTGSDDGSRKPPSHVKKGKGRAPKGGGQASKKVGLYVV